MRIRGLHAGPNAPQAHQIVAASSPSFQRVGSSAKVIALLCPGDERASVEAIFGEEGRAFELKAQSLSNPSPPSDTTVGCKLKGPSGLGQNLGGTKPSRMEVWSRREENATRKGKAPVVQMRDSTQEEETIVSKKMWSTLFPPSIDHRQGHQSSSEPLLLRGTASSSEVHNLEEDFGTGSQMERGIRENPLFHCQLSQNCNFSREETSAFREEDKEGLTGRVGSDPRGSSDMDLPSISIIRGKGLIFEGICESPGAKNMEVCQPSPFQPPESSSFPSCSLESPLSSPSSRHLSNSVSLS